MPALAVLAAVTMTFGNLAAYGQTNLKRLLAYSTISHAGFMIAGLATLNQAGAEAVLFYLATYLLMNLGAFAVVAFLRNATGSEEIPDFRGLVYRAPGLVIALAVFLLASSACRRSRGSSPSSRSSRPSSTPPGRPPNRRS